MKARMRTRLALLVLALAAPALVGCGEVNSMLDAGAGKDDEKAKPVAESSGGAQSARAKLDEYYNRESRKVEHDPSDPIVSCRLQGRKQYMRKSDCFLKGGSTG